MENGGPNGIEHHQKSSPWDPKSGKIEDSATARKTMRKRNFPDLSADPPPHVANPSPDPVPPHPPRGGDKREPYADASGKKHENCIIFKI